MNPRLWMAADPHEWPRPIQQPRAMAEATEKPYRRFPPPVLPRRGWLRRVRDWLSYRR